MKKCKKHGYSQILLALVVALGVFILPSYSMIAEASVDDAAGDTDASTTVDDQDSTDGTEGDLDEDDDEFYEDDDEFYEDDDEFYEDDDEFDDDNWEEDNWNDGSNPPPPNNGDNWSDDNWNDGSNPPPPNDNWHDDKDWNDEGNWDNNNHNNDEGNWNNDDWSSTASDDDCKFDKRDARRLVRELEHMIKKEERMENSTVDFESLLSQAKEISEALESCGGLTWEELDEYRQALHGENGISSELNVYRCWNELGWMDREQERMDKDQERTRKHLEEVLEFADDDWTDKIEAYLDSMERLAEIKAERKALMESTECKIWTAEYFDEQMDAEDLRYEEEDIRFETEGFWWEFEEMQHLMWANKMFEDILDEIEYARENEYPNLPDALKDKFDKMAEVAETLVAKGKECSENGKQHCVKEVQMRLEHLGRKAGKLFGAPEDFRDLGIDDQANENLKDAFKDKNYGEATDVITYLLNLDPSLVNKISDPAMVDKMFKILGHVPENMKGELLGKFGDLKDAFDNAHSEKSSLGSYKEMILGRNYFGQALDDLIAALEEVKSGTMTVSELVAMLENLQSQSRHDEVSMGVAKFEDATSENWFYDAAHKNELGISGKIEGGKAMFDPSGTTTFSEMLKVLSESMGMGQVQGNSDFAAANGHWAQGYYKAVEGKGITLLDPNHKITRGEMARLMVELLGLPIQEGQGDFSDLQGHKYGKYIKTLNTYGVMQGDPEGTVRPNDTTNRAEAFTMAKNALEELQFAMDNYDLEELTDGLDDLEDMMDDVK